MVWRQKVEDSDAIGHSAPHIFSLPQIICQDLTGPNIHRSHRLDFAGHDHRCRFLEFEWVPLRLWITFHASEMLIEVLALLVLNQAA